MSAPVRAGAGIVTLLSDFGTQDGYAAAMKGVVLTDFPEARLVDVTHEVPPMDILAGAFALAQAAPRFPSGTVHLAVVDPGVGSSRRALVVEHEGSRFVGPDNGLLTLAAPGEAWVIDRVPAEWKVHPTFHGRDLFARVAAHIAAGARPSAFSTGTVEPVRLVIPRPERAGADVHGEVIHVDRFGNLVTNVPEDEPLLGGRYEVELAGGVAQAAGTYADAPSGRLLAYRGSAGYLEIAVRDGDASRQLSATRGTKVRLRTIASP